MNINKRNFKPALPSIIGILWISFVVISYYYYNSEYFIYKFLVFGDFILNVLS